MIDWLTLVTHAFWIVGLATVLATFSLVRWWADLRYRSLREMLSNAPARLALATGFGLFGLGLLLAVEPLTYKLSWGVFCLYAIWEGFSAGRSWLKVNGE